MKDSIVQGFQLLHCVVVVVHLCEWEEWGRGERREGKGEEGKKDEEEGRGRGRGEGEEMEEGSGVGENTNEGMTV